MPQKQGLIQIFKSTFSDFSDDDCPSMAGSLAYYTIFALPPLLLIIISVAGLVFGQEATQGKIVGQIQGLVGQQGAQEVQTMIQGASKHGSGSIIATVVGIIALIFGATGVFMQLQTALNKAWEVQPDPKQGGIKVFITKRLLSMGMILGIAFLLLVSLAVTAALSALGGYIQGLLPSGFSTVLLQAINFVISFVIITLLFGAMFKVLPDAKVPWKSVWLGAVFTTLLFLIGKLLIGLYLGKSDPGSAYGAAGSLIILLLWIYYASMILLFGAEFTESWAKAHGAEIEPSEGAIRVVEKKEERPPERGEERAAYEAARGHAAEQRPRERAMVSERAEYSKQRKPMAFALVGASVGAFLVWLFRDSGHK